MFPGYAKHPLAWFHHEMWQWFWQMQIASRPEALIALLARGAAKSTTAELGVVACATRRTRRYVLYVSETQPQADKHVETIGSMLESDTIGLYYPELGERLVSKYGHSKGWRGNRLRTSTGFTIDAIGLDKASRGIRVEDQRPDLIILDDLDGKHDSALTTQKKTDAITAGILPAGAENVAIMGVQNLITKDSIFSRIADGRADFLRNKKVLGPVPGIEGFEFEQEPSGRYRITGGTPTWAGGSLLKYERDLNDFGVRAFLSEVQHEVRSVEGAISTQEKIDVARKLIGPDQFTTVRTLVSIDPAVSDSPTSDGTGIIVQTLATDRHVYLIEDLSCRLPVAQWAERAIRAALKHGAGMILYEENQGKDAIGLVLRLKLDEMKVYNIAVKGVTATKSKFDRAISLGLAIDQLRWHPVGHFPELETQICTTTADGSGPSPNELDATVHGLDELMMGGELQAEEHLGDTLSAGVMEEQW